MITNQKVALISPPRSRFLTRQRRLVLEVLQETTGHLDASMVYREAKKKDDRISLATVYRSLDYLKREGLIEENSLGESHAHFEATSVYQHYHFCCLGCGKVIELKAAEVLEMLQRLGKEQNLQVEEMSLYLRGYCENCKKNSSK